MTVFVVMGVAGVGKTTIGQAVATELGLPFIEGDAFHPPENIAKMSLGTPLSDTDRRPWIERLTTAINARHTPHCVVACSALTHGVRAQLIQELLQPVCFIHLIADPQRLERRLRERPRHYMRGSMLASQLETLELPRDALIVDANRPLDQVTADVSRQIAHAMSPARPFGGRP